MYSVYAKLQNTNRILTKPVIQSYSKLQNALQAVIDSVTLGRPHNRSLHGLLSHEMSVQNPDLIP
jgi:hypothetical protein